MAKLEIYVSVECWTGGETDRIVAETRLNYPDVDVQVINGAAGAWPSYVFATPTYVLNGRVISLGNPEWQRLSFELRTAEKTSREMGK